MSDLSCFVFVTILKNAALFASRGQSAWDAGEGRDGVRYMVEGTSCLMLSIKEQGLNSIRSRGLCNSHKLLRILIKLPPKSKVAPNGKGFQKVAPNSKSCRATCGLGYTWLMMSKAHDRTYIAELELIAAVSVNIVHVRKTLETLNRNHQVTEVVGVLEIYWSGLETPFFLGRGGLLVTSQRFTKLHFSVSEYERSLVAKWT